jgi:hypothetical protein
MLGLYRSMSTRGFGLKERLSLARCFNAAPLELVSLFRASVAYSALHQHRRTSFHDVGVTPAETLEPPVSLPWVGPPSRNPTYLFASKCREGLNFPFAYVDRELECLRTPAPDEAQYDDLLVPLELDLLFATRTARWPILAELKINDDRDAVYGLIQVLAAAAYLVSDPQRACLTAQYPDVIQFCDEGPYFDLYVLLFRDRGHPLKGTRVDCVLEALVLAAQLEQRLEVAAFVHEIKILDSWLDGNRLHFAPASTKPTLGDPLQVSTAPGLDN